MKLHIVLAKTDAQAPSVSALVENYTRFFKEKQGAFRGEQNTYQPKEGTIDKPEKRGFKNIQTTVDEKFDYAIPLLGDQMDLLLSMEATNASGIKVPIEIGKKKYEVSSLELLRLKNWIETSGIRAVIENIPVRSDEKIWSETSVAQFEGRPGIFEGKMIESIEKTTEKTEYILEDPNLSKLKSTDSYKAQVSAKNTVVELGNYTHQEFSGEWTQRQKAEALRRLSELRLAVIEALKKCNDAEAVASQVTGKNVLDFILYNK